ncbi:MAG: nitroreductase family protein, partial [Neisseriaceae bacterium]|nr:nitroreductase family protein [Neisseriaceae bacterium]
MNPVTQTIQNHASVRKYQDDSIDHATISAMVASAQHAATSHFVQAYSVIHVTDPEIKQQLAALSGNRHVATSGAFLVFCADLKRLAYACAAHDAAIESTTTENTIVATVDVALLAQNFALVAEAAGYGICYIGGIRN